MTTDREATRIVRSWLEEGVTVLPDRVLDAVLDLVPTTPQRRARWPVRRFADMNYPARIAVAAAAVFVAAALGFTIIARGQGAIGPARPTTGPSPTAETPPSPRSIYGSTVDDPGTYRVGAGFPAPFDFTITDTWETWDAGRDLVRIWKPSRTASGVPDGTFSAILSFEIVKNTYADPCLAVLSPQIGGGVNDLVSALTNRPGFVAGPVTDVSVDGYTGKSFELDKIPDPSGRDCSDPGDWLWVSNGPVSFGNNGAHMIITALDVNGTRVVVLAVLYGGDEQEIHEIIDSIDFE
jgi:hypothetical protein